LGLVERDLLEDHGPAFADQRRFQFFDRPASWWGASRSRAETCAARLLSGRWRLPRTSPWLKKRPQARSSGQQRSNPQGDGPPETRREPVGLTARHRLRATSLRRRTFLLSCSSLPANAGSVVHGRASRRLGRIGSSHRSADPGERAGSRCAKSAFLDLLEQEFSRSRRPEHHALPVLARARSNLSSGESSGVEVGILP